MRAYRKTTQHPFCVYLTPSEAATMLGELSGMASVNGIRDDDESFVINRFRAALGRVVFKGRDRG